MQKSDHAPLSSHDLILNFHTKVKLKNSSLSQKIWDTLIDPSTIIAE